MAQPILGYSIVWHIHSLLQHLDVDEKVVSCGERVILRSLYSIHTSHTGLYSECHHQCGHTCSQTIKISHVWQKKKHFSCLLWPYCALFRFVTPPVFPLIQSSLNGNSITLPTKGVNFFFLLVCVWREGPIISAMWEFKRHACSNLLFHSPGPLSSQSSFPVSYSSYPSTGKPPPAAASDPELSS